MTIELTDLSQNASVDITSTVEEVVDSTEKEQLLDTLRKATPSSFEYILYNGIIKDDVSNSLDSIIGVQDKLFDYGLTLSGFQFVGIIFESSVLQGAPLFLEISYFFLAIGFVFSLFGSLLSYITMKYILSIKHESPTFIAAGILKYKNVFTMSYIVPFFNCILFLIPINMILYQYLRLSYCLVFNIMSFILFVFGVIAHQVIIFNPQSYLYNGRTIRRHNHVLHND